LLFPSECLTSARSSKVHILRVLPPDLPFNFA
jgi:hypothetical protein